LAIPLSLACAGYSIHPSEFEARGGRDTLFTYTGIYDPLEDKRFG